MSKNNDDLDKDKQLIKSIQNIQRANLTIQKSLKTFYIIIFLIFLYVIPIFLGLYISDLFVLWAIITPYGLFLINYYRNKDKDQSKFTVFIQEIKDMLYSINFLREVGINSPIKERFKLLYEFKKELRKINCYLIEKKDTPTLLIYTNRGKYEANKDNIVEVYPADRGPRSILNQDDPISFINSIIDELKENI